MDNERLKDKTKEKDVFQRKEIILKMQEIYKVIELNFTKSMVKLGKCIVRTFKAGFKQIRKLLGRVGEFFKHGTLRAMDKAGNIFVRMIQKIAQPIADRKQCAEEIRVNLNKAKKQGKKAFIKEIFKSFGRFYCGAGGLLKTAFNYTAPVVSIAFLIGIINYTSGLEYGLSVEYNGEEIGIISQETELDSATAEVRKRISQMDGSSPEMELTPKYSLKIVDSNDQYVNSSQLVDKMLNSSDAELTEAYGIYIDGEFLGAVSQKDVISEGLSEMLANSVTSGKASNVKFSKEITYEKGLYLTDSLTDEEEMLETLTSSKMVESVYIAEENDTPVVIALKCNMSVEELTELNPEIIDTFTTGDALKIRVKESFLPVEYTRTLQTTSYIDYDTVEVETNKLYKGQTAVLTKGVKGEIANVENVRYVNGVEVSREIISSEVVKEPVTEEIGIGTYTAMPSSSDTVLAGSGQFVWPVQGGYISSPFGMRWGSFHKGMDIAAPAGTAIFAAADGEVIYAGWDPGGYGNCIRVDHGNGYVTVYSHETDIYVSVGDYVSCGQVIGTIGSTGDATGNHLHFEVRYNGIAYDPANYLSVN